MGGKEEMKKRIFRNLFCAIVFAAICFGASQVFATVNFDLKTPTTGNNCLDVYDFDTTGTTTNQAKVVKNCKDVLMQIDVISVPGTETLTLSLDYSLNDAGTGTAYGSMTSLYLRKVVDGTITGNYASGSETVHYKAADYGGTHTGSFGGAFASIVTGSTSVYRATFPCEVFLRVNAVMTNGIAGNNACKFRVSFVDADPFGHNPRNP